uniref:Peptidase M12B domain-containing protein n=1 Tax=Sphenodon punctatus TaxID=8508 RepID=A0A8D0GCL8_SPHPU
MVTDKAEFQNYPNLKQMQTQALEIASQMDAFYRPLGLRVALVGIEVWHQRDRIRVDSSPRATLERFLEWRQRELLPQTPHDSAQLLTGIRFANESLGMATQGSICSGRSGGVSTDHSVSALVLASTLSHQLGHNLGLLHDGDGCSCQGSSPELPPSRSCIMEPSTGLMPGLSFSGCSRRELERSLRGGRGWCLLNMPEPRRLAGAASCGNRLVEQNEECDCGLREVGTRLSLHPPAPGSPLPAHGCPKL